MALLPDDASLDTHTLWQQALRALEEIGREDVPSRELVLLLIADTEAWRVMALGEPPAWRSVLSMEAPLSLWLKLTILDDETLLRTIGHLARISDPVVQQTIARVLRSLPGAKKSFVPSCTRFIA
jgi:hypothetical protein